MLGTDFARTLRAAQAGEEDAFARLWRDANPTMIRYLRVVGHDDPYDEACEGWITVVRGLPGFAGDELAWRVWLLACARQRAEESTLRRAWGSVTVLPGMPSDADDELGIDELFEPDATGTPAHRGINETLTALRALPLGQGEVVVLHLGAGLPPAAVADVIGVDAVNIQRAEARALERLGTGADLLRWSLAAPATTAELADEHVALSAFRKIPVSARRAKVKVIAIGRGSGGATMGAAGVTAAGMAAAGAAAVGRSRAALLTASVLSVSVVSLGGLGAAAYVGVLPDKVQQVLHQVVGAPAPRTHGTSPSRNPGRSPVTSPTAGVGPRAAASPAAGLCRAWSTDKAKGTARDHSVAFRSLSSTAGGADKVEAYCAGVLAPKPQHGSGSPTAHATPSDKPSHPTHPSKPPTTHTPNPNSPTAHGPNPHSTKSGKGGPHGKSASPSPTAPVPGSSATNDSHTPNPRSSGKGPKPTSTSTSGKRP
ncbi:DNA-directed RNA polymerase specialized sigma24 family protein [Phycicoccus badiiscoriae]|uniref:DNA-directed RNA polymerase specialized sigma24 family protein n=1 Tax=Pedococcus badiiscoriae TaxID=642776 RepID=A0A852WA94_9MICO|nr:RNA polymerase sigma factor [Pedococcus badiiscoriae]NYG05749.1 DNA-directed RNA polymerase specialized sigma24 family protein [Pedococcus badiiscoriae]